MKTNEPIKGSELIEKNQMFEKYRLKHKAKIAMNMFFKDAFRNIKNGYPVILNHGIVIQARMHKKEGRKRYSKAIFFNEGKMVEAINPHFPDHFLSIELSGEKMEKLGITFKASGNMRKACREMALSGFGFNLHTS